MYRGTKWYEMRENFLNISALFFIIFFYCVCVNLIKLASKFLCSMLCSKVFVWKITLMPYEGFFYSMHSIYV